MINLAAYRGYMQSVVEVIPEISGILPVTIDKDMGKRIQSLPADSVTLFLFPPMAESTTRRVDAYSEENRCVIFLMKKFNPMKTHPFDVLEEVQPTMERVKSLLVADTHSQCPTFSIDVSSIETAPETELYGTFAGWSLGFNITTY